MDKAQIIEYFDLFSNSETDGLESLFSLKGKEEVFTRLSKIEDEPLSKVQLNQLLIISGLAGITYGFYKYYWLATPETHPYNVKSLEDFEEHFTKSQAIVSLQHLRWGLRRVYIDTLLYYGNITNGYRHLSTKKEQEMITFFENKRFPTETIMNRGKTLDFEEIPKFDRYLISEMACKTYEAPATSEQNLKQFLIDNYHEAKRQGRLKVDIKELFTGRFLAKSKAKYEASLMQLQFSAEEIMEEIIESDADIEHKYEKIAQRFFKARKQALQNTKYYLSLVNDLDIYVATSMRGQKDFIEMADTCEKIFKDPKIRSLHLRYFDPTISAADGHEDKGLIECLMVRCAKVLVYSAGVKESYGKDAEAAMALSTGKPVIFYCMDSNRADFYKKVHPLTKLIDFSTGVANGAMVTFRIQEVVELLCRIFENRMEYNIEQPKKGYFRLIEKTTGSPVRIQTNNELLTNSFWNYFDRFVKD
jgi:hypothetical protein